MVRFLDDLYASDAVRPKISSIKWKMLCGIGMTRLHFITLSDNKKDLFDIYPAAVFKQKSIRRSDRVILGIAESSKAATALIEQMINDCLRNSGDLSDIRGYYEQYVRERL